MLTNVLIPLVFLISAAFFSLALLPAISRNFFFRAWCIILSVIIISSFPLSYIGIPLNLITYSVLLVLLASAVIVIKFIKYRNWKFLKDIVQSIKQIDRKSLVFPLVLLAITFLVGLLYFRFDLKTPQYYSIDAATHFLLGRNTQQTEKILLFEKNIYFPDSKNLAEYPFGAAVTTSTFFNLLPTLGYDIVFQLLMVVFYALVVTYFYQVFQRYFKIKSPLLNTMLVVLLTLGFFLSLVTLGFTAQLIGLFLVLGFVDLYAAIKNSYKGTIILALVLGAIFFTYYYWIPIIFIFLVIDNFNLLNLRKFAENKQVLLKRLVLMGIFALLLAPYIYIIYKIRILGYSTSDGSSYKVFLLNFIFFMPFIILGLFDIGKSVLKEKSEIAAFIVASIAFTGFLYVAYRLGKASPYTFAKSYYLTGPLLYFVAVSSIEKVANELKHLYSKLLIFGMTATFFLIVLMLPFEKNVDTPIEIPNAPTFSINTLGLDGRLFDVLYVDVRALIDPEYHRINLDDERTEFFANVRSYLPQTDGVMKISTMSDYDTAMWFYVKTDIWPRSLEDHIYLYDPQYVNYDLWKQQDNTCYFIMIGSYETNEWLKKYDFNMDDFETIYQVGDNYLFKQKNCNQQQIVY